MFLDASAPPSERALAQALGPAAALWAGLASHALAASPGSSTEWKYSGSASGWSFRVKDRKRNLVYMLPGDRAFRASFALGEKAVAAVLASGVPERVKDELRAAKRYAEGRPLRLEVASAEDAAIARAIVEIKIAH